MRAEPLDPTLSFPRLQARTRRFRLGSPHAVQPVGDGSQALFLRSGGPADPATALWLSDLSADRPRERLLADPRTLLAGVDEDDVPAAERARRERSREQSGGIVAYDVDADGMYAAFALSGRLWLTDITTGRTRELPAIGPVIDPRISPDGSRIAWSTGPAVHVVEVTSGAVSTVVSADGPDVTWGLADFIAAEEMDRYHGLWWSPDSRTLLAQRTDESTVATWYLADPAHPDRPPEPRRYPQALTRNADVRLYALDPAGPSRAPVEIGWDHEAYEYLAVVHWSRHGDPIVLVQSRDQRDDVVLSADPTTGDTRVLTRHHDDAWLELIGGLPALAPGGRLVDGVADPATDTYRLRIDGEPFSPPGLQVRGVLHIENTGVVVRASRDPCSLDIVRIGWDGRESPISDRPGVHLAAFGGSGLARTSLSMDDDRPVVVHRWQAPPPIGRHETVLTDLSGVPGFVTGVQFATLGEHELRAAVVRPGPDSPFHGADTLPVLVRPYGGPGHARVMLARGAYWEDQWWADQGFVVLVADGRGTPGRGPAWDRQIRDRFAEVSLADQIEAVRALPQVAPEADLSRVAMIGWSYGGFLSALAVLRAPEVFAAAVAGAPPTDWTLYDTHYTERYLGLDPAVYRANSLIDAAAGLRRPLLLVHGMADDNVAVANTLRLSSALLAAGRPHGVLPLTGITHMTTDEAVAEGLLLVQLRFLRQALGLRDPDPYDPDPHEPDQPEPDQPEPDHGRKLQP